MVKAALVPQRGPSKRGVVLLGVELRDAREEMFVIMVCDGLPLRLAYKRAGFESKDNNGPSKLFSLPRVQERAHKILEARRTTGVVTLSEVTNMLQRVFAGAHSAEEYSAAHNAAFSLARLYGHVTDKATLEVIRRPSRDPDAPSEQVLSDWVKSLPVVGGSMSPYPTLPEPVEMASAPSEGRSSPSEDGSQGPPSRAPAALLGPGPSGPADPAEGPGLVSRETNFQGPTLSADKVQGPMLSADNIGPRGPGPESAALNSGTLFNDINGLAEPGRGEGRAGTGNGPPVGPVTGTPTTRARSELLARVPVKIREKQVPVKKRGKLTKVKIPSAEELF